MKKENDGAEVYLLPICPDCFSVLVVPLHAPVRFVNFDYYYELWCPVCEELVRT